MTAQTFFCLKCWRKVELTEEVRYISSLLRNSKNEYFCPTCGEKLTIMCQCCGINPAVIKDYRGDGHGGIDKLHVCPMCLWLEDKHFHGLRNSKNRKAYIYKVLGYKLSAWKGEAKEHTKNFLLQEREKHG